MSDFAEARSVLYGLEGGYSNNPVDYGKETYKGISRRFHPEWEGWEIIDGYKDTIDFPSVLDGDVLLDKLVDKFYKTEFWDKFWGDKLTNQRVANTLLQLSVHLGVERAVRFLQKALNALSRNGQLYKKLVVDGVMGQKTFSALKRYCEVEHEKYLIWAIAFLQGEYYLLRVKKSPEQWIFLKGWLSRAIHTTNYDGQEG